MRKFAGMIVLAAGILGNLGAAPIQSVDVFTPGKENALLLFHRRDNSQIRNFPVSGNPITVDRADAPEAAYFDCQANPAQNVPEFTRATFRSRVFLPPGHPVRSFNLRLIDADDEVFQFSATPPQGDGKWHEIAFAVDASRPEAGHWGGGAKADGKLTMPVRFRGVTGDFAGKTGTFGIGGIRCDVLDSNAPVSPELRTGSGTPIHVLKAGEEEKLSLSLRNPRPRRMAGTLKWNLVGVRGELLGESTETVDLAPAEEKSFALPRPSAFGVYKLNVELCDKDPAVRPFRREMRFAYLIPAGPTQGRAEGFVFGICSNPQRYSAEIQRKEAMAAGWCGVKALRSDVGWDRVQPAEGRWEFGFFDQLTDIFGAYGIELMPIYSYCAGWAVAKGWKPLNPDFFHRARPDYDHWRTFVGTFAARYRGKIRFAEIWNEPDLYMFANFPEDEYVRMLETAYDEIKRVAPELQVFCGGFACLPGQSGRAGNPRVMPAVIRSGKYDIFAFHGHGLFGGYRDQIERLPSYGNRKPWYANETAVSSMVCGEEIQAQTLFRKLIYSWAKGALGYNWYDLRNDGFDPANNEHNFGMLTHDFYPKPVYAAYNALANLFQGGTFLRECRIGKDLHGYLFRDREGNMLLAAWSDTGDDRILPLAISGVTGHAEKIDLYGNRKPLAATDKVVTFEVGSEPATLRVSGQSEAFKVAGALIHPVGGLEVVPGESAALEFAVFNPGSTPRKFQLGFALPDGISAEWNRKTFELAAGKTEIVRLPVQTDAGFRSAPGRQKELTLFLDDESFRYRIDSVARIPKQGYHQEPDFVLDAAGQVYAQVPNSPETAHLFWKGTQDLSAKVWMGRDGEALLLKVEVLDDRHEQPYSGEEVWKGDNIQFAFLLPGQNERWEIGLTRLKSGNSEVHVWQAPRRFDPVRTAAEITLETSRDENSHTTGYEARIPFKAIGLTDQAGRDGFRFNLLVNDNDGFGRESFIAIGPGIGESKDPSRYPVVKF